MDRRSFLAGAAAIAMVTHANAQPRGKMPRVGLLIAQPVDHAFPRAFREGLREHGYVEGKNIQLEIRSVQGAVGRFPLAAAELVQKDIDVLVAGGGTVGVDAAIKAAKGIPVVFPIAGDPIGTGLVRSLARPGGNATGLAMLDDEMSAKRVQLVKELMPGVRRIALLADPGMLRVKANIAATLEAGRAIGVEVLVFNAGKMEELPGAFGGATGARVEALLVLSSSFFSPNHRKLVELAAEHRLPTIWEHRIFTDAGGLMSYGPDIAHMYRTAARYVDKILKGARPSELPVEQATKFDLVVNLKAAKAQGITIPGTLLVRADQVIQ